MRIESTMKLALFTLLLACGASFAAKARADDPAQLSGVPDALKPWIPWVEARTEPPCPSVEESELCTFHTALALNVDAQGGNFSQRVALLRDGIVNLPGSLEHWPSNVRVDNKDAVVVEAEGRPSVRLSKGVHVASGNFLWSTLPDTLPVPADAGLVSLRSRNQTIDSPKRDADGLLWLSKSAQSAADESDTLRVSVHRRIDDGVPLRILSRFTLYVSGKARELLLPKALLADTHAIALVSSLPAEMQKDGALRVHVEAGEHRVEIDALREFARDSLLSESAGEPWPSEEIWVFSADEQLRHVELSGVSPLDPARTDLAGDFRGATLQTYTVKRGTPVTLTVKRRGESEPAPNELELSRSLWLDLDGTGFTAHDELNGRFARDFRLTVANGELGRASVDGVDQMITQFEGKPGVEVRTVSPRVSADLRFPNAQGKLPAVGYAEDVERLNTTLYLPPGHRLLYADGPDSVAGAWADGWNLFDFFFVLLVALGTARLIHPAAGLLALVTLVLTHSVYDAPAFGWVVLLAGRGVMRLTSGTRAEKPVSRVWMGAVLVMAIALIPITVSQLRSAIYPQLEAVDSSPQAESPAWLQAPLMESGRMQKDEAAPMQNAPAAPEPAQLVDAPGDNAEDVLMGAAGSAGLGSLARGGLGYGAGGAVRGSGADADDIGGMGGKARAPRRNKYISETPEPLPVVQTGPGLPRWRFHSYNLQFTGPVQHDQQITLWIVPPALDRLWSLLAAITPLFLLAAMVRGSFVLPRFTSAAVAALCFFTLANAHPARADGVPDAELLNELQRRIAEAKTCKSEPLAVQSLDVRVDARTLSVVAEVHVACEAVYQAPGPVAQWAPADLRVDGKDAVAVSRLDDGFLYVRLAPGIHRVELRGPSPRAPSFTLSLGGAPHRANVTAPGYVVEGLASDGQVDDSLSFRREVDDEGEKEATTGLTQWVEVTRSVRLGVRLSALTRVARISPASEDLIVRVPLLPGENVSQSGFNSDQGSVLVQLRRGESEVTYTSTLADTKALEFVAAVPKEAPGGGLLRPISERWEILPTTLYHPRFSGIAPTRFVPDGQTYAPSFSPYPGEKLVVQLARLQPTAGADVTIDQAVVCYTPGARLETIALNLSIRTSNGSTESLTFPADTSLRTLTVNGVARPERLKDGKLALRLGPGSQEVALELTRTSGMEFSYAPSPIRIGRALSNVTTEVRVPDGKWLLWTRGPAWGPAVLFWGYVLAVVLFGLGLSRIPHAPLSTLGFCLLGLGLMQVDAAAAVTVVVWLFALAYRARHAPTGRVTFNLMQLALLALTLIALSSLVSAVQRGLVMQPDMQVAGNDSAGNLLRYYVDQSSGVLPSVHVYSVSIWVFRGLMLIWALWLAFSLLGWLRRGAEAFRTGGMFRPWFAPKVPKAVLVVERPTEPSPPPVAGA